jgi:hypothetical protein
MGCVQIGLIPGQLMKFDSGKDTWIYNMAGNIMIYNYYRTK